MVPALKAGWEGAGVLAPAPEGLEGAGAPVASAPEGTRGVDE